MLLILYIGGAPKFPQTRALHLTSTNTPPEFYKQKQTQQIVQVVKWEAQENQFEAHIRKPQQQNH